MQMSEPTNTLTLTHTLKINKWFSTHSRAARSAPCAISPVWDSRGKLYQTTQFTWPGESAFLNPTVSPNWAVEDWSTMPPVFVCLLCPGWPLSLRAGESPITFTILYLLKFNVMGNWVTCNHNVKKKTKWKSKTLLAHTVIGYIT